MSDREKMLLVNYYNLTVSFPDINLVISDAPEKQDGTERIKQRNISYTEVGNYFERRFPARILSLTLNYSEINKMLAGRSKVDSDTAFNIDVMVNSIGYESGVSQLLPFKSGKYKGFLENNEAINTINTIKDQVMEQNIDLTTDVTFYLLQENEMKFSLNNNINFVFKNTSLMGMFAFVSAKAIPGTKMIISKFDHNPTIPQFIIPSMGYKEFIELISDEFGMYKNGYVQFVDSNIMYFLNKDNDSNVTVQGLDYEILLDVARETGKDNSMRYYQSSGGQDRILTLKINDDKINIFVNNSLVIKNDPIYISPDGTTSFKQNSSARNADVVRKITNVKHLDTYDNLKMEFIEFPAPDVSLINVNPLTTVTYIDSAGQPRKYRVCFKYVKCVSDVRVENRIRAFRLLLSGPQAN